MDKTPQFNIEETFCEYLSKYYRGSNNPASSKTLEAVFHVKGSKSEESSIPCEAKVNPFAAIMMATSMRTISMKSMQRLPS